MALRTAVLQWKNAGSLGRTGRGDEENMLPSKSVTNRSALNLAWRIDEELTENRWVRIKGKASRGDIIMRVCYRPSDREE